MRGFRSPIIAVIAGVVVGGSLLLAEIPDSERDAEASSARADAAGDGPLTVAETPPAKQRQGADRAEPQRRLGSLVAEHVLRRFDRDGDGKLALAELPDAPRRPAGRLLADADQDGDGVLERQEITRALARLQRDDRDGDDRPPAARRRRGPGAPREAGRPDGPRGQRSRRRADRQPWPPRLPGGPPSMDRLLAVLDRDDDRELSTDEIAAAAESLRELDRDGDGRLCRCELAPERYEGLDRYRPEPPLGDRRPPRRPGPEPRRP